MWLMLYQVDEAVKPTSKARNLLSTWVGHFISRLIGIVEEPVKSVQQGAFTSYMLGCISV